MSGSSSDSRAASDIANSQVMLGNQRTSVLRNGLYNIGGQAVRNIVSLITIPLLIRILGIRQYGVWSLAYSVLALVTMAESGISVAASVFLSRDLAKADLPETDRTLTYVLVSAIVLAILLGLFLWLTGPQIVRWLVAFLPAERAEAGRAIQLAGLAVSFLILQGTLVGIEQAFDRYAIINALDLSQSVMTNVGLVVVAWLGGRTVAMMKWQGVVCAALLAAHCGIVFQLLRLKGLTLRWGGTKSWQIFKYSFATWGSTLGNAAFSQCDRLIVGGVLGAPLLGVYSAVTSVVSRINLFSGTAAQPLVPSLSHDIAGNIDVQSRLRQAVRLNAFVAVQAGVFIYLLADRIMSLIIPGATVPLGILGLQVVAIIYTLYSLNAPGYFVLFSVGKVRTNAVVVFVSGMASLALISGGARHFGLLGALLGNAGYLGTLFLIVPALMSAKVPMRDYFAWMAFPLGGLIVSIIVGFCLSGLVWYRAAFAMLQGILFILWFLRDLRASASAKLGFAQLSESR
jgi:O-antigen/teichoic acid export membrane protein